MAPSNEPDVSGSAPPSQTGGTAAELRRQLVTNMVREGGIRSPALELAFLEIPREIFLPAGIPLARAYSDDAIVVKWDEHKVPSSSSTQPILMADMIETLQIQPGMRVLEIGAGVGYNAAVLAHLLGDGALLTTIDLDPEMADTARRNLHELAGLLGPSYDRVKVMAGDGSAGFPANAPYDRIIVTVQQWDLAPEWVAQLKTGGVLLLPLTIAPHMWGGGGIIPAFEKQPDGTLRAVGSSRGAFMHMRGQMAHPLVAFHGMRGALLRLPMHLPEITPVELPPEIRADARWLLIGSALGQSEIDFFEQSGPLEAVPGQQFGLEFSKPPESTENADATSPLTPETQLAAFYGFNIALAAAVQDRVSFVVLATPAPGEADTPPTGDATSYRVREGWRYETHGLALLEVYDGVGDLAMITAAQSNQGAYVRPVQGWRLTTSPRRGFDGPNQAILKLTEAWQSWDRMGRPNPVQYRLWAFPSGQAAPAPGYVIPRPNYNLLLPF